jgi:FeS assembly SUF system regulator
MIRLSRLTDYAVALLSYMGKEGVKDLWAASDLAEKSGLPMPTVAKVLKLLAKSKLISAQRGAMGGYKLMRPAPEIKIVEIIEAMDGPINITDCTDGGTHKDCQLCGICPMSNGWKKINSVLRQALQNVSLAEMEVLPLPFPVKEREARFAEGQ